MKSALAFLLLSLAYVAIAEVSILRFLSLGDWGEVNSDQANVAAQMANVARSKDTSFVLAVGDNFYNDGVVDDQDPQWNATYADVYSDPSLQIPWYAILGNHDHHYGRGQGEIDFYKNKRDNRWIMPDYWYTQVFTIPGTSSTVEVVFIDTILLTGQTASASASDAAAIQAMANKFGVSAKFLQDAQLQWIENTLAASKADWLIVTGHYPIFSGGEHGNNADLQTMLKPLLEQYPVDIYLCGHDHTLQHLHDQDNSVEYFVSGNGAKRGSASDIDQTRFAVVDPGFMVHEIMPSSMKTTFVDGQGTEIYVYEQAPRPKK